VRGPASVPTSAMNSRRLRLAEKARIGRRWPCCARSLSGRPAHPAEHPQPWLACGEAWANPARSRGDRDQVCVPLPLSHRVPTEGRMSCGVCMGGVSSFVPLRYVREPAVSHVQAINNGEAKWP